MKKAVLAVTLAAAVAAGSGNMPVWNGKAQEITSETYMPVSASKDKKKTEEKKTEETSAAAGNPGETYVIRPGDTLYQISLNRYGTVAAMEQICALNGISANEIIYPGQVIVLP